jgi:NCAIR mutase (PurE)-related protein
VGLREELTRLLEAVARGDASPQEAVDRFASLPARDLVFARVDVHRELRQGAPEAVFAHGKQPEQVVAIAKALLDSGAGSVLVTRASPEVRAALLSALPDAQEDERAQAVWVARSTPGRRGLAVMISAGTSDGAVLHEARIRAELLGAEVVVHEDVGVAGLHRLAPVLSDLERADCVVVVAGMEGALPSVVAGMVSRPVVGVPTNVGYGAAFEGVTALLAMLSSCAPGVTVVNIDNGFGAALAAHRILRASTRAASER